MGTNLKKHQHPHREKLVQAVVINDLSFQIQTLDSSMNLAISDILSRLDALENKS